MDKIICLWRGLMVLGSGALHAKTYTLHTDSHIGFAVKKFGMMTINGVFQESSGTLELDNSTIKSLKGEVVITSVFTDSAKRDAHLLKADFLDSKLAPKGYFVMKSYEAKTLPQNLAYLLCTPTSPLAYRAQG